MGFIKKSILMLMVILLVASCGKKISKIDWTPNQHLDYAIDLFNKGKYLKAQNELNFITIQFSGTPIMDKARFYLARTYFHTKEYLIAISEFNRLIQEMPESPLIADAQFNIGLCYEKMSPRAELDQEFTQKAIKEFQLFIETFPKDDRVKTADEYIFKLRKKLAIKVYKSADIYKKNQYYQAAIVYYQNILDNYYDLDVSENALYYKGYCEYKLKNYEESQKTLNIYIGKYESGKFLEEAKTLVEKVQSELSAKKE